MLPLAYEMKEWNIKWLRWDEGMDMKWLSLAKILSFVNKRFDTDWSQESIERFVGGEFFWGKAKNV